MTAGSELDTLTQRSIPADWKPADRMLSHSNPSIPDPPMTCPTCGKTFSLEQTPTPPFCSERCQLIDLGRWFNEDIGLPSEGESAESEIDYRDEQ